MTFFNYPPAFHRNLPPRTGDECIEVSDDDGDVELLEHIVNIEPYVVDLTNEDASQNIPSSTQKQQQQQHQQPQSQQQPKPQPQPQPTHNPIPSGWFRPQPPPPTRPPPEPCSSPAPPPSPPSSQPPTAPPEYPQQQQPPPPAPPASEHDPQQPASSQDQWLPTSRPWTPEPSKSPSPAQSQGAQSQDSSQSQPTSLRSTTPPEQATQAENSKSSPPSSQRPQQASTRLVPSPPVLPTPSPPPSEQVAPPHDSETHNNSSQSPGPPPKEPQSDYELMVSQKELGNEKYRLKLFDDALHLYTRANELAYKLDDHGMAAILHFNIAMTYDRLRYQIQVADECSKAIKFKKDYMKAHLKRAEIYERLRKYEEAVICYEHICELVPNNQEYAIKLNRLSDVAKLTKKSDHYQILGLKAFCTRDELKKAYHKKALIHHPDRHSDGDEVSKRIAEKTFKEIQEAKEAIQRRMGYRL